MAFKIPSGSAYTTTSQGTGDLLLNGSTVNGRASLKDELAVNDTTVVLVDNGAGTWEVVAATRLGSADRLMRTACLMNSSGGTDLIDWQPGTKTISAVIPGEWAVLSAQSTTFLADQHFNGYKVTLNAGKLTWLQASTQAGAEVLDAWINNKFTLRLKEGELRLYSDDAGATAGPTLVLDRGSATPAGADIGAGVSLRGRDSGGNVVVYAWLESRIGSAVDGAETGVLAMGAISGGNAPDQLVMTNGKVYIPSGNNLYVGKTAGDSGGTAGIELNASGQLFTTRAGISAYFNRTGGYGDVAEFRVDGSGNGTIRCTAGNVGFVQPSDARLKKDVRPYAGFGAVLDALEVVTWLWKANGLPGLGVIAQEVAKVRPDLVSPGADGMLRVHLEGFIPDLLAEAHDGRRRERQLEARLARLEARLAATEASE